MSKAILILDEMPMDCDDCAFCQGGYLLSYLCGLTGNEFEFINGERKGFCPLKPMPKKKNTEMKLNAMDDWLEHSERVGFNKCIDELVGEEE